MAPSPAVTPGRKKRDNVFFQPGVQGRKTGITLKDTGRRDEHGFEPLDAIFSSPEKSPPKRPTRAGQAKTSDSVGTQKSPAPEVTAVLSARRSTRSARLSLPPPKARSPIKTHLNSSPQRHPSLAPASVARQSLGSPIRPAQMASLKRRIDFNQDMPQKSIEFSPQTSQRGSRLSDAENMPPVEGVAEVLVGTDSDTPVTQTFVFAEDTFIPTADDDSIEMLETNQTETEDVSLPARHVTASLRAEDKRQDLAGHTAGSPPTSAESLKRKRRTAPTAESQPAVHSTPPPEPRDSTVYGAPGDSSMAGALPVEDETVAGTGAIEQYSSPRRGNFNVHRDATDEESEDSADEYKVAKPAKKSRRSSTKPSASKKSSRPAKKSSAPRERDPNTRPAPRAKSASKAPSDDGQRTQARNSRATSKPRSLQILRQGTPLEEPGATKTRSGRQSIQPVAWWCGERINRDYDGTIKDVVRAETVDLSPKRQSKKATRPKKSALGDIEEEGEEEEEGHGELEPWEENGGILTGLVKAWDSEYNMTIEDDEVEMEVGFASKSIQTRDVMGANFSYAKLLTLPFFGAGVVDLPPGGFKRAKNSRKMQMAFFVHSGKVLVTVSDLEFWISKGGAWQVPRGNFYSIENRGQRSSRIFFSQGYERVAGEDVEG